MGKFDLSLSHEQRNKQKRTETNNLGAILHE